MNEKRGFKNIKYLTIYIYIFLTLFLIVVNIFIVKGNDITLSEGSQNYTIQNEFYKAVIPKPNDPNACGLIRELYINNSNSQWSSNIVYGSFAYGLGFLEGTGDASANRAQGLQNSGACSINILENTSRKIVLLVNASNFAGSNFTQTWTFWAKKPYFKSEASVIVVNQFGFLTNQYQFCWMINNSMNLSWYGTDNNGNIQNFSSKVFQQINSPNITLTYPFVNWQFTDINVSLGLIFTDIYDYYGTIGETGDWNFEYQLNFGLGGGVLGTPTKYSDKREVTTIYYTSNSSDNTISNFSKNSYQGALTSLISNPVIQAANFQNNSIYQNNGSSSALVNSPYFLVRQNSQNRDNAIERLQYTTSIYAPLYKSQSAIHSGSYDYKEQITYLINYNNGSTILEYGNITQVSFNNSNNMSILEMNSTSSDNKIFYNSKFISYNDSDKLHIIGNVSNASSSASVKDIYISLDIPSYNIEYYYIEAENTTDTSSVNSTGSGSGTDGLWRILNRGDDIGTTLVYTDNQETVPALPLNLSSIPDGAYLVTARVLERISLVNTTYRYSTDNVTWYNFTIINQTDVTLIRNVSLGKLNITNYTFFIDDDNNASGGISAEVGWDGITLQPVTESVGSNIYDIHFLDGMYGEIGVGIKVNTPTINITLINNSNLQIYLYFNETNQTLTNFTYPFDIEIYPHKVWLDSSSDFTALHSINILNYTKHAFYSAEGIHNGRTNLIYSSNAITYSTEPYNSSSLINMIVTTNVDLLNIIIENWTTIDNYYKKWNETSTNSTATANHTIGDLSPNTNYDIKVNDVTWSTVTSNSSGWINFLYNGGYSTKTFEVQDSNPQISIYSPANGATYTSSSIVFNISTNENSTCNYTLDSGITNYSMTVNSSGTGFNASQGLSNTNYIVRFYCWDTLNNLNNSESSSFTINTTSSSSSSSSSGGGLPQVAHFITDSQLQNGYTNSLRVNNIFNFNIGSESHKLRLTKLTSTIATINVSSNKSYLATFLIGDLRKFELDNDNFYDIFVKLNSIKNQKANFTIQKINEEITPQTKAEEQKKEETAQEVQKEEIKNKDKKLIILISIIGFIVILIVFFVRIILRKKSYKY